MDAMVINTPVAQADPYAYPYEDGFSTTFWSDFSIADAFGKQRTDAYCGFDNTAVDSACLRNADMQRIITLRCHQTISLQCQRHIMRFE